MTTLEEGLAWYESAVGSLSRLTRLAEKYWHELPWDGKLRNDNKLGLLEADRVVEDARRAEEQLNDMAVVLLFSIFEGIIRAQVAEQVRAAAAGIRHPVLTAAAKDAVSAVEDRSFAAVLNGYAGGGHADLAEQVRRVREYRNHVAHGRRTRAGKKPPDKILPRTAYERLSRFLQVVSSYVPDPPAPPP